MGRIQTHFNRTILIEQGLPAPLAQTVLGVKAKILHHIGNQAVGKDDLILGIDRTCHCTTQTATQA